MNDGVVLYVGMVADLDVVDVAPQYGVVPNAGMIPERYIAHNHGPTRNVRCLAKGRLFAQELVQLLIQSLHDQKFFEDWLRFPVRNLSTYLPRMSVSRFTASPTLRSRKAVTSRVCGIIQMLKLLLRTVATVRLIPSTAIDPFK